MRTQKLKMTVEVETRGHPGAERYKVVRTTNTTKPRVGDYLSEAEVEALIADGIHVVVK